MTGDPEEKPRVVGPTMVDLGAAGDDRLLSEFRYAVDHWVAALTPVGKRRALEYLQSKVEGRSP